jgi:transcriptional regulator with XRE-family HTH domain
MSKNRRPHYAGGDQTRTRSRPRQGGQWGRGESNSHASRHMILMRSGALKLLKRLPTNQIADLSGLSASHISQVKHGKCQPSQRLVDALADSPHYKKPASDYMGLFLESREAIGASPTTMDFYRRRLTLFALKVEYWKASRHEIERYLNSIHPNANGLDTRHASFRAMRVFYRWLSAEYGLNNPMANLKAPILSKVVMPSLTKGQVEYIINSADCPRDRAIVALFAESVNGLP